MYDFSYIIRYVSTVLISLRGKKKISSYLEMCKKHKNILTFLFSCNESLQTKPPLFTVLQGIV